MQIIQITELPPYHKVRTSILDSSEWQTPPDLKFVDISVRFFYLTMIKIEALF